MLYAISNNSSREPEWARIMNYTPVQDPGITHCEACGHGGQKEPTSAIELDVDPGSAYPNIMHCDGALPLLVVSRRVARTWLDVDIKAFEAFPATITNLRSQATSNDQPIPEYCYIRITGRGVLDQTRTPVKLCAVCGDVLFDPELRRTGYALQEGSWNGLDLLATDLFPMVPLCTERVLTLARQHLYTNFRFTPAEQAGLYGTGESV